MIADIRFSSENIGARDIPNVNEVHCLLAITKDNRNLPRLKALHPPNQHFGVAPMDIHTISVDIEVSEGDVVEPVHVIERPKESLIERLGSAIERSVVVGTLPLGRRKIF